MHKRETLKIVLITLGVLAVIVINAIIFTEDEPDILTVPQTVEAKKPVPDFSQYTNVKEKKAAFFDYLRPEVEKQNAYLLTLRHYIQTLYRKVLANETLTEDEHGLKKNTVLSQSNPPTQNY
jgi:Bax protein